MMTEADILERIFADREALEKRVPDYVDQIREHEKLSVNHLRLVETGLRAFPTSVRLWALRGDLIQLGPGESDYSLDDAETSYRTALRHDPNDAAANESLGYYLDVVQRRPADAEQFFRKAIASGAGESARAGLSEVLEELGRAD